MARRFIDDGIFADEWFCELPNKYKLLWIYLLTNCSTWGVYKVSYKQMSFNIGESLDPDEVKQVLHGRIVEIDGGRKWFIPRFITYQYPRGLHSNKPAIISIRQNLLREPDIDYIIQSLPNDYLMISKLTQNNCETINKSFKNDSKITNKSLKNDSQMIHESLNNDSEIINQSSYNHSAIINESLKDDSQMNNESFVNDYIIIKEKEKEKDKEKDKEKEQRERFSASKAFEAIWRQYPNRKGKKAALRHFLATVKTEADYIHIKKALQNYMRSATVKRGFIQNGSTWFNDWESWVDPTPEMLGENKSEKNKFTYIPPEER